MINFDNIQQARTWLRELDEETTVEYGDYSVMEYSNGEIELVAIGEEHSDTSDAPSYLGTVAQVLY